MDQKFCTTIVSADPRKSLRPRESHPGVIPDYPGLKLLIELTRFSRRDMRTNRLEYGPNGVKPCDVPCHSVLSVLAGSTVAARCAGKKQAGQTAAATTRMTARNNPASRGATSYR